MENLNPQILHDTEGSHDYNCNTEEAAKGCRGCCLEDVVTGPAIDRDGNAILHDNGTPISITALFTLAHLTMEQLRPVFTIWGVSGCTGKKEHLLHKVGVMAQMK
jgi:hypothetical protein